MAVDQRRYWAADRYVFDRARPVKDAGIAMGESNRMAKRIANALNFYRVRRRKSAEKSK